MPGSVGFAGSTYIGRDGSISFDSRFLNRLIPATRGGGGELEFEFGFGFAASAGGVEFSPPSTCSCSPREAAVGWAPPASSFAVSPSYTIASAAGGLAADRGRRVVASGGSGLVVVWWGVGSPGRRPG
ncbi:hypothetical protein GUJ93_ZPchr0004g39384 [Zizania palustris]|uniref:Uncharacterized protein n=1 Tax=Zizania palustris TaxID=103762 RepID=A0A8J5VQ46_ZIZPA|nr:hypothetical protein GUJ93_ZPchr0004g39384 [Zizania palustris]